MKLKAMLRDERRLPWIAAILGAILACWVILQEHGSINQDGVLYVEVARLFSIGEWQQGLVIYNWLLYPLLMAGVHHVTGLSFQFSVHAWAVFAFAMTAMSIIGPSEPSKMPKIQAAHWLTAHVSASKNISSIPIVSDTMRQQTLLCVGKINGERHSAISAALYVAILRLYGCEYFEK